MRVPSEPRHRIGAVVRLSGVSAHALRAWERRYGALHPERSEAGDRLYSDSDVRRLRLIKRLTDYGHAIGNIARLDEKALEQLLEQHTQPVELRSNGSATNSVERYLDALAALDIETAERTLRRAAISRDPRQFITQIAEPLLAAIGTRWKSGALCVANEHAASAMLRTHLGMLLSEVPTEPKAPSLISTTPSGERHELGALIAALVSALSGRRAVYLGPDLPAAEIATAARSTSSSLVLLSIVALPARKAHRELDALLGVLPARVRLLVGGAGAEAAVRGLDRVEHAPDWAALTNFLAVAR